LLQKRNTVSIWLYEQLAFRIEGKIRVCAPGPGDKKELSSTRIELCD
jgi:hypothetical protein